MATISGIHHFVSLPADTRARILCFIGEARQATQRATHGNSTGFGAAVFRATGELEANGLGEMAEAIDKRALQFDSQGGVWELKVGARLAQIERTFSNIESGLLQAHRKGAFENATNPRVKFDIRDRIGKNQLWGAFRYYMFSEEQLTGMIADLQNYLGQLPLHERYAAKMWTHRGMTEMRPATLATNLFVVDMAPMRNLVERLLVFSSEEGMAVEKDTAKVVEEFKYLTGETAIPPSLEKSAPPRRR